MVRFYADCYCRIGAPLRISRASNATAVSSVSQTDGVAVGSRTSGHCRGFKLNPNRGRQCQNDFFLLIASLWLLFWPLVWRAPDCVPRRKGRISQLLGDLTLQTSTRPASLATTSTNSRWAGG